MSTYNLRQRPSQTVSSPIQNHGTRTVANAQELHPAGVGKHGPALEVLRFLLVTSWSVGCCVILNVSILLGAPLYYIDRNYYYAYVAMIKQAFALVVAVATQWFAPTTVRVSWDASLRGQFRRSSDGRLETRFPERIILLSNHQIYTDWVYLWWSAYTSRMHGHLFIILKESIKYVPILTPGIMFFGFIFMARKWTSDQERIRYRLQKLNSRHSGPMSGSAGLDPMWMLIFPEGTNLSRNTRKGSVKWAEKQGIPDLKYLLLPRSTGLHFCLEELKETVDWVYDCTIGYEGVPKGGLAPEYFTLRSIYLQGRPPKSVNMYWRRFAVSSIPLQDPKAFESWLLERWKEKDALLEQYYDTGRFPADLTPSIEKPEIKGGYIETEVRLRHWFEIGQIFVVLATLAMVANVLTKGYEMFF